LTWPRSSADEERIGRWAGGRQEVLRGVGENRKVLWRQNGFDDLGFGRTPPRSHPRHPFLAIIHPAMSKVENTMNQPQKEDAIPGLGVLEEDDEFEEFPVQGKRALRSDLPICVLRVFHNSIYSLFTRRNLQTGMIHRRISLIWRVLELLGQQSGATNCGRITGMTMISRRSSAHS